MCRKHGFLTLLVLLLGVTAARAQTRDTDVTIGAPQKPAVKKEDFCKDAAFDLKKGRMEKVGDSNQSTDGPYVYFPPWKGNSTELYDRNLRLIGKALYKVKGGYVARGLDSVDLALRPEYLKKVAQQQVELALAQLNLPNLQSKAVELVMANDPLYNGYAYAVDPDNPPGWVGPTRKGSKKTDIPIKAPEALFKFFAEHGWKLASEVGRPVDPTEDRIVLFARQTKGQIYYETAARVTHAGVYAKLGAYGVFKLESIWQMAGGEFGDPFPTDFDGNPIYLVRVTPPLAPKKSAGK